jgi:hypothetical protein
VNLGAYEAPVLTVLGSVSELTLDINKQWGASDGFTLLGVPITNASA